MSQRNNSVPSTTSDPNGWGIDAAAPRPSSALHAGMGAEIERYLAQFRGEVVDFFPSVGNGGDSVIAVAAYQLFDRLGIRYRLLRRSSATDVSDGRILIVGGGGNLVPLYTELRDFLAPRHRKARRVVILPHGVRGHADLIAEFGTNVDVICRDLASRDFVESHAGGCGVSLMHDLAFSLNIEDARKCFGLRRVPRFSDLRRYLRHVRRSRRLPSPAGSRVLNAFRLDRERCDAPLPPDNIDLTGLISPGTQPEFVAYRAFQDIIRFLDNFEIINTNRLHVGILSILIGKEVFFYENSYRKIGSVYKFSMESHFPKAHMCVWDKTNDCDGKPN